MSATPQEFAAFLNVVPIGMVVVDADHHVVDVNPEASLVFGTTSIDIRGRSVVAFLDGGEAHLGFLDLVDELDREVRQRPDRTVSTLSRAIRLRRADGAVEVVSATAIQLPGSPLRRILTLSGLRPSNGGGQLGPQQHDALTGLPTRPVLLESLRAALSRLKRHPSYVGVIFLDLDRMKAINDRLGHQAGDRFLCDIAARLRGTLRDEDMLARFGGDEFVVVISDADSPQWIEGVAHRLRGVVSQPMVSGGESVDAAVSIGIVITDDPTANPDNLIRDADTAMYESKRKRAGVPVLFDPVLRHAVGERVRIEADLRRAVISGEIETHFQPIVALDGGLRGAEALVRWRHPERGLLLPADFLPLAEETGLVHEIWQVVVASACRRLKEWRCEAGHEHAYVSVNISPRQFGRSDLVPRLSELANLSGVDPSAVRIEVTETALVENAVQAHRVLDAAAEAGFGIALDDFGTGYSSLSHLQDFPVTMLKVDRSFTCRFLESPRDAAIVRAVIELALALGMEVCAEGVETQEQADALASMKCTLGQGFLWGAAEPAADFQRRMAAA